MTTDISLDPAATAGASTENVSPNAAIEQNQAAGAATNTVEATSAAKTDPALPAVTPVVGSDGKVAYVPNYKYKAALQEKELDPFFHSLVKDPESEKKVKELFTKVDAFDFIKGKNQEVEGKFSSLLNDYGTMSDTVTRFNQSVKNGDLSSAFRLGGINRDQIFNWVKRELAIMDLPPEQRQAHEQSEQAKIQNYDLEQQVSHLRGQYEHQAVQARTMQLEMALSRPEVARFAEAWDRNSEQPNAFKKLIVDEAKRTYYESLESGKPVDLSPEQAVAMVMQKFGKFLNVGDTATQSPQAIPQQSMPQSAKPVIPNVTGKAASPIKKVFKNLDDIKAHVKTMRD